ncbi:hypothetical protein EV683_12044 [Crenobacter luteus]|uniref:Uncharacterized protein n=1 Tax=Crenobacter luteus TaxID=1452487 RepID=A0A165G628_9NEIS|nr:hypothetical protein [Crenobacter luteus]KZE35215.1 hypothetical protein AVW16_04095 [Crenobacter luteus]TCP10688.1 hypothetical protein EV683_12044 [Crenobacter luteus]
MRYALWWPLLGLLAGCNWFNNVTGLSHEANKAIGAACRQTGRSLEACYQLNPDADKAQIYAGWREMHEYMEKHKLETMAPAAPPPAVKDAASAPPSKPAPSAAPRAPLSDEAADKAAQTDPQVEAVLSAIRAKTRAPDGDASEQGRLLNLINELNDAPAAARAAASS